MTRASNSVVGLGIADANGTWYHGFGLGTIGAFSPNHLAIDADSSVFIGGLSASNAKLTVNGNASKPGGGAWSVASDARLKHDIQRIGFVAQDVEQVFPEWVTTRADGYKALSIYGAEAITVEAIRELNAEKDAHIRRIKARNAAIKARIERLGALQSGRQPQPTTELATK